MTKCEVCNSNTKRRTKKIINSIPHMVCYNCKNQQYIPVDKKLPEPKKRPIFYTTKLPIFPPVPTHQNWKKK